LVPRATKTLHSSAIATPSDSFVAAVRRAHQRALRSRAPSSPPFAERGRRYFVVVPAGVLVVGVVDAPFAVLVVGVDAVGVEVVGVDEVGVEAVGVDVVGVEVVGVEAVGVEAVPVAGSVFGGSVVVVTSDVSPDTATNAAATPPRPSTNTTVAMMIGTRQLPGRRMRVVAA
jgi:hypothetical protein